LGFAGAPFSLQSMQTLFEKTGKVIPHGKRGSSPFRLIWQRKYLISCRKDDTLLSEAGVIENPTGMENTGDLEENEDDSYFFFFGFYGTFNTTNSGL
jgi:hypothetical protein